MRNKLLFYIIFCFSLNYAQVVSTLAGNGSNGSVDGTGTGATFNNPQGTAVDASGNIYVADRNNNRIRKITIAGVVTTLAGSSYGFLDGTGTTAKFRYPTDVAVDAGGNIYVADSYNHRIRKITPDGVVTTLAGSGYTGSTDTTGILARFNYPSGVAADDNGNVYVADKNNSRIRKISSAGVVTTLAGSSYGYYDGTGTDAKFRYPMDVAVDGSGTVFVADQNNHLIRKILADGTVTTLAGSGSSGNTNGTGTEASFYSPGGLDVDDNGIVYVADVNNHRIRKISVSGVVTTIAGNTPGFADGTGTQALFYEPYGIAAFGTSHLYIGDYSNQRIRSISLDSTGVTTEEVVFAIAGGSSSYNITASTANNGSSTGGINLSGTGFISDNSYLLKVSFDQGNTWNSIAAATATTGTFQGSGIFSSNTSGNVQLDIAHSTLSIMAQWPGNDGTITMRVSDSTETFFFPNSSGQQFVLDLTRPIISYASIQSNNANNTTYAKIDDNITISFLSTEMLSNTILPISGNINGNTISVTGSGTSWSASSTVSSIDPEGIATFEVSYYDVNGNAGGATLTSTTDASTVIVDKTAPTASNVTILSSNDNNTQATTGDTIKVTLTSNEALSSLSDVKIAGQTISASNIVSTTNTSWNFWYVIQGGEPDGNVDFTFTANDIAGNGTTVNIPNSGSVSFSANPKILWVTSTNYNGSYNAGNVIGITVHFIESVYVTGIPQLTLETGSPDAVVGYTSGSGTNTLRFDYTVSESDSSVDLSYTSGNALALNGSSIQDSAGNNAVLTLPEPGSIYSLSYNKNIIIDNVVPVVTSVSSNQSNGTFNINDYMYIYVHFNESIYVTGTPKLELAVQNGEDSTNTINYYSKSGTIVKFRYQVASGDTTNELDYTSSIALTLNNGTIKDAAGNPAILTLPVPGTTNSLGANRDIVIDGIAPVVISVTSSTDDGIYKINDDIIVDIQFSQPVSVSGTPVINLQTGGSDYGKGYYSSGSNTNKLTFIYNVSSGHSSSDLEYINHSNALYGTIRDPAYNDAIRDLPELGSQNSLSGSSAIIIDGIIPTITGITSTSIDSTYKIGDIIDIQVNFSEAIEVTGTPQLTLETGNTDAVVNCISGAGGSDSLIFTYTIASGHSSIDLDYTDTTALDLNGGTIRDVARNPANLILFSPDSTGSLAANKAIVVDGIVPAATSVSFVSNNTYNPSLSTPGNLVTISLVMSEAIQTPTATIGG
ncbi:MAG: NHL repeat-containing protein, partial [Candidatus Marinimicrobia bacterium]|nr:NHL repeat-containing protein [Candidatus Neomarinimicrobiota bacterium]